MPLDAVVDPYEARQDGAPQLYDDVKNNISVRRRDGPWRCRRALAAARDRVKARIRSPRCHPMPMEPRGDRRRARPDHPWSDRLDLDSGAALEPQRDRRRRLGLGQNQVRCIAPEVGGGFGCKIGAYPEDFVVCRDRADAEAPGQMDRDRAARTSWPPTTAATSGPSSRSAPTPTARSQALRARVVLDSGAYPKALDLAWCTWVMSTGRYEIPNLDYQVIGVYTNTMANGAYRGAGRPEAAFYLERADGSARRRRWARSGRGAPHQLHPAGQVPVQHALRRALRHRRVREAARTKRSKSSDYAELRKEQAEAAQAGPLPRASASRPTSKSAASVRTRARRSGLSRAAR